MQMVTEALGPFQPLLLVIQEKIDGQSDVQGPSDLVQFMSEVVDE